MDFPKLTGSVGIDRFIAYCNTLQDTFNQVNNLIANPASGDYPVNDPNYIGNYTGSQTTQPIAYPSGAVKYFINNLPTGWIPLNRNVFIKVGSVDLSTKGNTNKSHTHNPVGITYTKTVGNYSQADTDPIAVESTTDDYNFTWIARDTIQVNLTSSMDSSGGVAYPKHITLITGIKQ